MSCHCSHPVTAVYYLPPGGVPARPGPHTFGPTHKSKIEPPAYGLAPCLPTLWLRPYERRYTYVFTLHPTLPLPAPNSTPCHLLGLYLCILVTTKRNRTGKVLNACSGLFGPRILSLTMPKVWPRRRGVDPCRVHPLGPAVSFSYGEGCSKGKTRVKLFKSRDTHYPV